MLPYETHAQEKGRHTPFNLSLIYPISLNRTPYDNVNINIGIIGSRFGTLKGFSINTVYSTLEKDQHGFQINGIYAEIQGHLHGIQLTGVLNSVRKTGTGGMIALAGNICFDDFKGVQLAGLANVGFEDISGLQLAGAVNVSGADVNTLQLSGLGNLSAGSLTGVQIAGVYNVLGNQNRGLQLGSINMALIVKGMQIGLFNAARDNSGLQLGIFNFVTNKQEGTSLGLFYFNKKTEVSLIAAGGNLVYGSLGVRFKTNNIYSILNIGAPVVHSSTPKSIMLTYRAGYSFPLKIVDLNTEIGYANFINEVDQVPGKPSKHQFAFVFRTGLERRISKAIGLLINAGYMLLADSYVDPEFTGKFLLEGGVVLF